MDEVTLGELFRVVQEIKARIDQHCVFREEFQALRERVRFLERIVFGFIGLIVLTVCAAIIQGVVIS
jgi:hypothetical protein